MDVPRLRRQLVRWFERAKRPLPWRRNRDPYAIWVSEMMLQQTTVATVIPYYERFMTSFPTIKALAFAEEDDVLAHWSGLGYYSRARNLHAAARQIVSGHGGRFPDDLDTALTLKGIGPYTARAVTSMAYGVRAAVVDGNVRRVVSRLFAEHGLGDAQLQQRADVLLPRTDPGRWNEAMMELGATICTPRNPKCLICPVASDCRGKDRPEFWSERKPRAETTPVTVAMALVERSGSILLTRHAEGRLLGGLYELPNAGLPGATAGEMDLSSRYGSAIEVDAAPLFTFRHAITRYRVTVKVHLARTAKATVGAIGSFHSLEAAARMPLGGLTRKALRGLAKIRAANR
jgi:A/G-specific adenine glycosylase